MTLVSLSKKWTNIIKVLLSRLNVQSVLLLISLVILSAFVLYRDTGKKEVKREAVVGEKQSADVLALQKSDLNGDGLGEIVTLSLLPKDGYETTVLRNAELSVSEDGIETASIEVPEIFDGTFEIVNLFKNDKRQIFLKAIVSVHSMAGYIYEFDNGLLLPICPQEVEGCVFFSDAPDMYARDFDSDGTQEIVVVGRDYDDISKSLYNFYAWSGRNYTQVVGEKYDKFLSLETGGVSAKDKLPIPTTKPKAKPRATVLPTPTPSPEPQSNPTKEQTLKLIDERINRINQEISAYQSQINSLRQQELQDTCNTDRYSDPGSEMYIEDPFAREQLCAGRFNQFYSVIAQIQLKINSLIQERNSLERQKITVIGQ